MTTNSISFIIPGNPMAWQRARRFGNRYFDSSRQVSYKSLVALSAQKSLKKGFSLIQGGIVLVIRFYFKRPKARCRLIDPMIAISMFKRPDADNCLKMIGDALNGIVWADDALICKATIEKFYHEIGGSPRTEVEIEEIETERVFP